MPRLTLLLICLLAPLAQADDHSHDLAYSLGVKLGERLRDEVPDLQLQALLDGLRQAYRNEPLALDEKRIESLLAEHEENLAAAPERIEKAKAAEKRCADDTATIRAALKSSGRKAILAMNKIDLVKRDALLARLAMPA